MAGISAPELIIRSEDRDRNKGRDGRKRLFSLARAQLARELGVRVGQLRTWRLEFEKEAVTGIAKPDRSAAEDVEQLRRENAKLKMEIEILKKAAIYFAREAK